MPIINNHLDMLKDKIFCTQFNLKTLLIMLIDKAHDESI